MKIAACLGKSLLSDAEREQVLADYRAEVASGADPDVAAKTVIERSLAQAKSELKDVMVKIAKAQTKEAFVAPESAETRELLGDNIDVMFAPRDPGYADLNAATAWFEDERVPKQLGETVNRPARPSEQKLIVSLVLGLFDMGVPPSWVNGVVGFYVMDTGPIGSLRTLSRTIGFKASLLASKGRIWDTLRGGVALHELHHALDSKDDGTFLTADSPLFKLEVKGIGIAGLRGGAIAQEVVKAVMTTTDERLRTVLLYPLDIALHAKGSQEQIDLAQAEIFAQLGRVYWSNPALMREWLPTSYQFFRDFTNDRQGSFDTLRGSRDRLQEALQRWTPAGGVRDHDARGARGGDGERAGDRAADRGLEAGVRDVAGRADAELGIAPADRLDGGAAARGDRSRGEALLTEGGPDTPTFGTATAGAVSAVGVHYGNTPGLRELRGDKYGSAGAGAERMRVKSASDDRVKKRIYFYAQESGKAPRSEGVVIGNHAYRVKLDNLYDLAADGLGLREAYNTFGTNQFKNDTWLEAQILNAGYDGYLQRNFSPAPAIVILNKDAVPVEYLGHRREIEDKELAVKPVEPDRRGLRAASSAAAAPGSDVGHRREIGGRYVGAPDWVGDSPGRLATLRRKLLGLAREGEVGRYWYEQSSRAILRFFGGNKEDAEKFVALIAIYSPNNAVAGNTTAALLAWYQWKAGVPIHAGMGSNDKKADALLNSGQMWSGVKTNSFYQNLMVEIDPSKLDPGVATMDMWMALAFDYGFKKIDQGPKYAFMEREIRDLADRLGWSAHQVQAAVWTAMKGRIDPIRGQLKEREIAEGIGEMVEKPGKDGKPPKMVYEVKAGREYDHFRLAHKMGMEWQPKPEHFAESAYDFANALDERAAQLSWEARPSSKVGKFPELFTAPISQQAEYMAAIDAVLRGADGRDLVAEFLGIPMLGTDLNPSAWEGDVGIGGQVRAAVAFELGKTGPKREVDPGTRDLINLWADVRGLLLQQDGVYWHFPVYDARKSEHNGVKITFPFPLTVEDTKTLYQAIIATSGRNDWAPAVNGNEVRILNFSQYGDSPVTHEVYRATILKAIKSLPSKFSGSDFFSFKSDGGANENDWTENPNGEGYRSRISASRRPDVLGWAESTLANAIQRVDDEFARKYGWTRGKPAEGAGEKAAEEEEVRHSLATSPGGMSARAVSAATDALSRRWQNAPEITVLGSPSEAPFKADPKARGAFWNGRVFLFASNLKNAADVEFTTLHEVAGHYGLRGVLGAELDAVMQRIFDSNENVRTLAADLMARYGYDQSVATEEALADLAGKGVQVSGWRMFLAAVRNLLRKAGFVTSFSDNDVIAMLGKAGRFAEKKGGESASDLAPAYSEKGPLWFSELAAKVAAIPMKMAPAAQWQSTIRSLKGVKPDEIEWSSVMEWLQLQSGKVGKDRLLEYLRSNGVRVEETMLGEAEPPAGWSLRAPDAAAGVNRWQFSNGGVKGYGDTEQDAIIDAKMKLEREARRWQKNGDEEKAQRFFAQADEFDAYMEARAGVGPGGGTTKYASYQLPGGQNYRELLLTLPAERVDITDWKATRFSEQDGADYDGWNVYGTLPDGRTFRSEIALEDAPTEALAISMAKNAAKTHPLTDKSGVFRSAHWDQPSIVAHIRFNERTDADGNKVLFIEEIQSDWAQKGRQKGFTDGSLPPDLKVWKTEHGRWLGSWNDGRRGVGPHDTEQQVLDDARHSAGSGVPRAPFVGKTEAWVALAIKRMVRYAAENGFDRVAFVNGKQSADRYDLSKQVDELVVYGDDTLVASNNGVKEIERSFRGEAELADFIGKDLAAKLLSTKPDMNNQRVMRGADLKIGGEGMISFYDKIVPGVAKEVLKKLGGKMTAVDIPGPGGMADYEGQPGFDVTDAMRETALGGMPLFSKMPDWVTSASPQVQAAAKKLSIWADPVSFKDRIGAFFANASLRWTQGLVDQFAALKELDLKAYMLARLTKSSDAGVEALLHYGKPFMNAAGAIDITYEQGGLVKVLQQLGGEQQRFFAWIAGNRAARLKALGKENLLTGSDITALRTLNQGNMPDGSSRAMLYARVHKQFNEYSKAVLDIAERAGTINAADRAIWEHDFYVPFYRIAEDDTYSGPKNVSGMTNQYAFKKLRGGTANIGDLLENSLRNWGHLMASSLKNNAAVAALQAAEAAGVAYRIKSHEAGKGDPFVMEGGVKQYWRVEDPYTLQAISALEATPFTGTIPRMMGKFKTALTIGVTASPTFRIRNLIRDSLQAISANEISYNIGKNLYQGWGGTKEGTELYGRMLAGGALMHFGTGLEGDYAAHTNRLINAGVKSATILDSPAKVTSALKAAWTWWEDTGSRSENMTRVALYQQTLARLTAGGMSPEEAHLRAAFASRDSMDFSLTGAWPAVRLLTQVVPFMNARAQGLYKLGREGVAPTGRVIYNAVTGKPIDVSDKQRAMRFGSVAAGVALASIALLLAYRDDDDWKKREEWDRDGFWWFKAGDVAYRIPKPFELGALGSAAERGVEMLLDGMDAPSRERFLKRLGALVADNLSMNPVPQIFKPILDVYANKDSFTGRPIESMGMERLSTSERAGPNTSAVARAAGQLGVLSPVQVDSLLEGYLGWLGAHAVMAADLALGPVTGAPEKPARKLGETFVVGDFAKEVPGAQSRFLTEFFDQSKTVTQAHADVAHYVALGRPDKAQEIREERAADLAAYRLFQTAQTRMANLNRMIKRTQESDATPEAKRAQIDRLTQMRNQLAQNAVEVRQRAAAGR